VNVTNFIRLLSIFRTIQTCLIYLSTQFLSKSTINCEGAWQTLNYVYNKFCWSHVTANKRPKEIDRVLLPMVDPYKSGLLCFCKFRWRWPIRMPVQMIDLLSIFRTIQTCLIYLSTQFLSKSTINCEGAWQTLNYVYADAPKISSLNYFGSLNCPENWQ
jgi:hypothetical protein